MKSFFKWCFIVIVGLPVLFSFFMSIGKNKTNHSNDENVTISSNKSSELSLFDKYQPKVKLDKSYDFVDTFGYEKVLPAVKYMDYKGVVNIVGYHYLYEDGSVGSNLYIDGPGISNGTLDDSWARAHIIPALNEIKKSFEMIKYKKYESASGECIKQSLKEPIENQDIEYSVCIGKDGLPYSYSAVYWLDNNYPRDTYNVRIPFHFSSAHPEDLNELIRVINEIKADENYKEPLLKYYKDVKSLTVL
ncbi:hypothetical protein ACRN9V_21325 [Shewanella baltica]|uniref:hypothetical protein n=1 Tax=Shewanella baltica TaxID=62322 RepID=UPI003D79E933